MSSAADDVLLEEIVESIPRPGRRLTPRRAKYLKGLLAELAGE